MAFKKDQKPDIQINLHNPCFVFTGIKGDLICSYLENDTGYKKVCIWKDEVPLIIQTTNTLSLCKEAGDIHWHNGIICIEARLNPRHISNYGMVFMKYTYNNSNKTNIIINYGREDFPFISQVIPFSKIIYAGLDKEFADGIYKFFQEYPAGKLPGGTIEILSGGYDEIASSIVSFQKLWKYWYLYSRILMKWTMMLYKQIY